MEHPFNLIRKCFVFCFSLYAFSKAEGFNRLVLIFCIVGQIGESFFGQQGTLGRVMLYATIFYTPAIAIIPLYLKKKRIRHLYIIIICFVTIRELAMGIISNHYMTAKFADFHTIFF